ncbi:1371_t:CDS:2, partial [Funneliformis geosporum]
RSLKLEYILDDNSSFMSLYDLAINPSDTKREYVMFWNLLTNNNNNIYRQITRKHLHIETADIRHFNLITNNMGLESLVKYPGCSLNGKKKCVSKIPFQNIVKIDIIGKKQHQKVAWFFNTLNQQQSFCASVTNWISSTRAKIFTLLTALIVSSKNSDVTKEIKEKNQALRTTKDNELAAHELKIKSDAKLSKSNLSTN